MKLLSKAQAQSKIKKDNDELIETNIRLRHLWGDITKKLAEVKEDYNPQKMAQLKAFEAFVKDITEKKGKLLGELEAIQKLIEQKKELYYSLITKQDELIEKAYLIEEGNRKLDLREAFVTDLEKKFSAKQS